MKRYLLIIFLFAVVSKVSAMDQSDSIPEHLQNIQLPDFKILLADGKTNFYTDNTALKYILAQSFT